MTDTPDMTPKILARVQRTAHEAAKAGQLRTLANANWSQRDLLEIFGLAMAAHIRTTHKHGTIGKNYFSNHFHAGARNPAGSKLLRRVIRQSSGEAVRIRRQYAALTGRQYNHMNISDAG